MSLCQVSSLLPGRGPSARQQARLGSFGAGAGVTPELFSCALSWLNLACEWEDGVEKGCFNEQGKCKVRACYTALNRLLRGNQIKDHQTAMGRKGCPQLTQVDSQNPFNLYNTDLMRCALCLSVRMHVSLKDNYSPALLPSPRPHFGSHEMVLGTDFDSSPAASVSSKSSPRGPRLMKCQIASTSFTAFLGGRRSSS